MKYRILRDDELEGLQEDFKHFLIVNGVHNEEWVEMNERQPVKAVELVELFSDAVLQKVYEKIQVLEFRSEKSCLVFKVGREVIELISIQAEAATSIDLSTPESIHAALVNDGKNLRFFKTEKAYSQVRELEIHQMIEQGCVPSVEGFWHALETVIIG